MMVPNENVKMPPSIDEKIVGVNPAAFGLWHGLKTAEDWRL